MSDHQPKPLKKKSMHGPHVWICAFLTLGEFGIIIGLFTNVMPEANQRIGDVVIGTYNTAWLASIAYWYQTTFGSNNKTEMLSKTDAIKE